VHTARCRFIVSASQPFTLQRESSADLNLKETEMDDICLNPQPPFLEFQGETLSDADYWEVDPSWDGNLFRSAAQAVRPRRNKPILAQLPLPAFSREPGSLPIAIRMVTIHGEHVQAIINK
jgi:hypothetical protein